MCYTIFTLLHKIVINFLGLSCNIYIIAQKNHCASFCNNAYYFFHFRFFFIKNLTFYFVFIYRNYFPLFSIIFLFFSFQHIYCTLGCSILIWNHGWIHYCCKLQINFLIMFFRINNHNIKMYQCNIMIIIFKEF
jgi:hypothetical protein